MGVRGQPVFLLKRHLPLIDGCSGLDEPKYKLMNILGGVQSGEQ